MPDYDNMAQAILITFFLKLVFSFDVALRKAYAKHG